MGILYPGRNAGPRGGTELNTKPNYIRALIVREDPVADVDEEIQFHIESRAALLVEGGMSPQQARSVARKRFGDVQRIRNECRVVNVKTKRERDSTEWLALLWWDLRLGMRSLLKHPGFTMVAVATLALGMGVTTAVVSLTNHLVLRPPQGVSRSARLGLVRFGSFEDGRFSPWSLSFANYPVLREGVPALSHLAGYASRGVNLSLAGEAARYVTVSMVMPGYFSALGVRPFLGRLFTPDDDIPGTSARVAVLSHRLWRTWFGTDTSVDGKIIRVNGELFTVVGAAPERFRGTEHAGNSDIWMPGSFTPDVLHYDEATRELFFSKSTGGYSRFVARLAPGASYARAQEQLRTAAIHLAEVDPEANAHFHDIEARLWPGLGLRVTVRERIRATMQLLLGLVVIVLAIACANVANLLLFRGVAERGDDAVRKALGASVVHLTRYHLARSVLLALAGAGVGILLALGLQRLFEGTVWVGVGTLGRIPLDLRVFGLALGMAVGTGLLFGILPSILAARTDVVNWLNESARTSTGRTVMFRNTLTVLQLSSAVALLIGALLFVATLRNIHAVDLGFDAEGLTVFHVDPAARGYSADQQRSYVQELVRNVRNIPGVEHVSLSDLAPFSLVTSYTRVHPLGGDPEESLERAAVNVVSHDYFKTLASGLLHGREFSASEFFMEGTPNEVPIVLSEALARSLFGDTNAVGRYVIVPPQTRRRPALQHYVIGVVRDSRWNDVGESTIPFMFLPMGQSGRPGRGATLLVRSAGDDVPVIDAVREVAAGLDGSLALWRIETMAERIRTRYSQEYLFARALVILALVGLALAAVGLYAVVAYGVAERTRELGIRIAIGARSGQILHSVLRQGAVLGGIGAVLGIGGALALSRIIQNRLFGISSLDPGVYLLAATVLGLVVVLASVVPARAATKVDPVRALRYL